MRIKISDLMDKSGVAFGTSGARGLAAAITDRVAYLYTQAFLAHLERRFGAPATRAIAIAGDLRPSTSRIVRACAAAAEAAGYAVKHCGEIPSPAVALYGINHQMPAIMVTGSHIPDDRNGIKFNRADGEIDKQDEAGMRATQLSVNETLFTSEGALASAYRLGPLVAEAEVQYAARYRDVFGADALSGLHVGVYQHSTVGRDLMLSILKSLGARVTALGRSAVFIPVDTEAVRPEDVELARKWARETRFDAIVSADGDCDRPLIADEAGEWVRGDVVGVLCGRFVGAAAVATPVSCNSVVERCGAFQQIARTRIGSPFVIEQMQRLSKEGAGPVVGYEANGGFLQQDALTIFGKPLPALPTRDAMLPIIALLCAAKAKGISLSQLVAELPKRFTASDRIKEFPTQSSQELIAALALPDATGSFSAIALLFGDLCGNVAGVDQTDGLRVSFQNGEIIHLRPSGNAPELRCYSEADSNARAVELTTTALARVRATL